MLAALDLGLIYGLMALGVYLTFRVLDFADLTVDGSFTTGGAVAATMIVAGQPALLATIVGFVAGAIAGSITGLLNTVGRINPLLAGILTQIALYSINLRIMGKANVPLLRTKTLLSPLREAGLFASPVSLGVFGLVVLVFAGAMVWFLGTEIGLGLQATGDNEGMARAEGVSTDAMKVLGLSLSNGLVALAGALMAQYQGYADIGMGIGLIVAGLASVILGQAVLGQRPIAVAVGAVVFGSVLYRIVIQLALMVGLNPNDMKLISALLVIFALIVPRWSVLKAVRAPRRRDKMVPDVLPTVQDEVTNV